MRRQKGLRTSKHREHGFTLLEVLVAVLLLSLAYVAVLQNFSQSLANIFHLESRRAADLAGVSAFAGLLRTPAEGEERVVLEGEVLVEGQKFLLKKIVSEDGMLETVALERR